MTKKIISAFILLVIGIGILPVVSGVANDVAVDENQVITETLTLEENMVYDVTNVDYFTAATLSDADIYFEGVLVVENGSSVSNDYVYDSTFDQGYYLEDQIDGVYIDFSYNNNTIETTDLAATLSSGDEMEIILATDATVETDIAPLVNLIPIIYVIVLISGVVIYIKLYKNE